MLAVELHQFPGGSHSLVYHCLEQRGPMADLQDGEPGIIEVQDRLAGLFKDFFGQNTGTGIEIMNHRINVCAYWLLLNIAIRPKLLMMGLRPVGLWPTLL